MCIVLDWNENKFVLAFETPWPEKDFLLTTVMVPPFNTKSPSNIESDANSSADFKSTPKWIYSPRQIFSLTFKGICAARCISCLKPHWKGITPRRSRQTIIKINFPRLIKPTLLQWCIQAKGGIMCPGSAETNHLSVIRGSSGSVGINWPCVTVVAFRQLGWSISIFYPVGPQALV